MERLFSEELGIVIEVHPTDLELVLNTYTQCDVNACAIGSSTGSGLSAKVIQYNPLSNVTLIILFIIYNVCNTSHSAIGANHS